MLEELNFSAPPLRTPTSADDIIGVSIPQSAVMNDVVYYHVTSATSNKQLTCIKRYSQFEEFHRQILAQFTAHNDSEQLVAGAILPAKRPKALISHTDPAFIEDRRVLLQHYLRRLLTDDRIAGSSTLTVFLHSDALPTVTRVPDEPPVRVAEDAEITSIGVTGTRAQPDHTLYKIDCSNVRRRRSFQSWTVFKRFNQAYEMDAKVREEHKSNPYLLAKLPRLPSKAVKYIVDHQSKHFIEHRRVLLDAYLKKAIQIPEMARNADFINFCGVKY